MEALAPGHLVVIAVVALVVLFGWEQLPDMSRSLGRSLRVFKTEIKGLAADDARAAIRDTVSDARAELVETTTTVRAVPAPPSAAPNDAPTALQRADCQ